MGQTCCNHCGCSKMFKLRLRLLPQRSRAHLDTVLETAVDGVVLINGSGEILMFNRACERLFGYRREETLGQNVSMLMPEPYRSGHDGFLRDYLRTGKAGIIGIGRTVTGLRKDGTTFPMGLSVGESAENGKPIFVGIIRDLTEQRQMERATADTFARLRAVVDTAVDGVILADSAGDMLMVNPACQRLFGYEADDLIGNNVRMLMPAPYHTEHDGYLARYHATGERRIIGIGREVQGQRKDGTIFPMDLSVGEALQNGEKVFVGVIHDLTERKRAERQFIQAQKMEAIGHVSGGIAHDFNNLLTVIMGNAELLHDYLDAEEDAAELARSIIFAAERGAELTSRLLAFGRRQVLQPTEIDCNELVRGLQKLIRRTLREDIEIRLSLAEDLSHAHADPGQLESALLNLALNAQDAMPRGGSLTIATAEAELDEMYRGASPEIVPARYVMLAITDDGEGMSRAVLDRVYEPFFTTKEVGKGSGLGLSMVYGFAKQSNGHVSIYSEPGLGTTVRIYLPVAERDGSRSARTAAEPAPPHPGRGEIILVVEDDPFVRSIALRRLKRLGYRVVAADNGPDAIQLLKNGLQPQLLFTDIVMPGGMSGWEVAEAARACVPDLRVLFTSGYPRDTLIARGRLDESARMITKPFRKTDLARMVAECLAEPPSRESTPGNRSD